MANDPAEWSFVAEEYERTFEPFMGAYCDDAIRLAELGAKDRVIDVATGPGTLAFRAARIAKEVLAVDFSDAMIDLVRDRIEREGIKNVRAAKMNGMALEVDTACYDAAFSAFGLIFFPDRVRGFTELHRVLAPGGRAVVIGWGPLDKAPTLTATIEALRKALPDLPAPAGPPPFVSLADPAVFEREMRAGGFSEVRVERITKTIDTGAPLEEFWDRNAAANAMIAPLRKQLGPKWAEVSRVACDYLRPIVGEGTVKVTAEATFGIGRV